MKVLAIGRLTGEDIGPYLEAEGRAVAELQAAGLIGEVFLKADRTGPVLLLNDSSADKAPSQLASLPFVAHALVAFEYIELNDLPARSAAAGPLPRHDERIAGRNVERVDESP